MREIAASGRLTDDDIEIGARGVGQVAHAGAEAVNRSPRPSPPRLVDGRDGRGRFSRGNVAALRHGGRSALVASGSLPEQADAVAALAEREAAILDDLGGADAVSTLAAGQVRRHVRLELIEDFCWTKLQAESPFTGKGRSRACVGLLLQVQDRLTKSASLLGLARAARSVNPLEAVRQAVIEANQP